MKYRAEFSNDGVMHFDSLDKDNLPPKWTFVVVYGRHKKLGTMAHLSWVVYGTWKDGDSLLEQTILAGLKAKGHELEPGPKFHYYPNRYKPRSRGCILHGYYSE